MKCRSLRDTFFFQASYTFRYIDRSFLFRTFLPFSHRDCRAVCPKLAKAKRRIRPGWDFFSWQLPCGFDGISYVVGFNDLLFFFPPWILRKNGKLQFLRTTQHVVRGTYRFFSWPKKNPRSSRLCRVCLFYYWYRTKARRPLNPETFLQVDFWNA